MGLILGIVLPIAGYSWGSRKLKDANLKVFRMLPNLLMIIAFYNLLVVPTTTGPTFMSWVLGFSALAITFAYGIVESDGNSLSIPFARVSVSIFGILAVCFVSLSTFGAGTGGKQR